MFLDTLFNTSRGRPDLIPSSIEIDHNNPMSDQATSSRDDYSERSSFSVRMRSRCPTDQRTRHDPNRRYGGILSLDQNIHSNRHDDLQFNPLADMDEDALPRRRSRNIYRPRPQRSLDSMFDYTLDREDICSDIENSMNQMREEMDMADNLMRLSIHNRISRIISIPKCKIHMSICETQKKRRVEEDCNIGLLQATEVNDLELVKSFVERGAELFYTNPEGWTALHIAASKGFLKTADFLISRGLYYDCRTHKCETPLMLAARFKEYAAVNFLLCKRASIRLTDKTGRTPLMHAAEAAGKDILKVLLDRGADVNATDNDGNTALMVAAMNKNDAAVNFLVAQSEVDLEKKSKEKTWTALHWAVATGSEENVRTLIKAGAAINACSFNKHETPIKLAHRLGNRAMLRLLYSLEAVSHRRVVYSSDGTEMKYYLFIIGKPLEGEPEKEQLTSLPTETQNLFQAMLDELRRQEVVITEMRRREQEEGSTASASSASLETHVDSSESDSKAGVSEEMKKQEPSGKAERVQKAKQQEMRKEIMARRRLIKRKLDPIFTETADELQNSAENSAVLDQVYPPNLKIKIQVFTLIFLCLETESVRVQNVSCVSVLGINNDPIRKKANRRG